jgi:uncharacterized membrane protein (DUF485 family)
LLHRRIGFGRDSAAMPFKPNKIQRGGTTMDDATLRRVESDPNFKKLVNERKSLSWTLSIIMLVIYYGFIALVAFAPGVIAMKVAGTITLGIIIGVAIILSAIVLTGIYVMRANADFDELTAAVVANAKGAK